MTDGGNDPENTDAYESFHVLSHELRLEILLALNKAPDYSLAFSELQSEVDEPNSGKFNYHLSKLEGLYIEQVDNQYTLKHPGHRVIDASRSGAFQCPPDVGPIDVAGSCPDCGGPPQFTYKDYLGTVSCGNCGNKLISYHIDPGAFTDRSVDEGIRAFDRWVKSTWRMGSDGVCFACAGKVQVSFVRAAEGPEYSQLYRDFFASNHPVLLELDCTNCSFYSYIPTGARLLDATATLGSVDKDLIDIQRKKIWEYQYIIDGDHVELVDTDPWEVRIEVPTEECLAEVTLDQEVSIVSATLDWE